MNKLLSALSLTSLLLLAACSGITNTSSTAVGPTVTTGLAGTVIGAGTGAIIGSVLSGGDVGASALLGAGIGFPLAAAGRYVYLLNKENAVVIANNNIIERNYAELVNRQETIQRMRVSTEAGLALPDPTTKQSDHFIGATIGY